MAKRLAVSGILVLSFLLIGALPAAADTLQGRVLKANRSLLDLTVYDAQGRPYPNALHLKVDSRTRLAGMSSASALKMGDLVQADVSRDSTGLWHADTVTKLQGQQAIQYTARPTPSLMDALKSPTGQKVIKSGLTGAITGAVASGASGGKAGKGALFGAAAGIAGGFLADLLGQPRQPQNVSQPVNVTTDTGYDR